LTDIRRLKSISVIVYQQTYAGRTDLGVRDNHPE